MYDVALIGLFAGLLTTSSQFPQAWRVYKTRSTGDLSGLWISILFAGTIVWLYYGVMISDLPLIIWNGISVFTLGYIALYKFNIIKTKTDSGVDNILAVRPTDQVNSGDDLNNRNLLAQPFKSQTRRAVVAWNRQIRPLTMIDVYTFLFKQDRCTKRERFIRTLKDAVFSLPLTPSIKVLDAQVSVAIRITSDNRLNCHRVNGFTIAQIADVYLDVERSCRYGRVVIVFYLPSFIEIVRLSGVET